MNLGLPGGAVSFLTMDRSAPLHGRPEHTASCWMIIKRHGLFQRECPSSAVITLSNRRPPLMPAAHSLADEVPVKSMLFCSNTWSYKPHGTPTQINPHSLEMKIWTFILFSVLRPTSSASVITKVFFFAAGIFQVCLGAVRHARHSQSEMRRKITINNSGCQTLLCQLCVCVCVFLSLVRLSRGGKKKKTSLQTVSLRSCWEIFSPHYN